MKIFLLFQKAKSSLDETLSIRMHNKVDPLYMFYGRPPDKCAYMKIIFPYFSTKTYYGVGTQKNRFIETVL